MSADEEDREPPLTEQERKAIRQMLERDRRAAWVFSTLRIWATWAAAIGVSITVMWDVLKKIAKAAVS